MIFHNLSRSVWTIRVVFGTAALLVVLCMWLLCRRDVRYRSGRLLVAAVTTIAENSYSTPEPELLFEAAWLGMAGILDPYTSFIPPASYRYVDEESRGSFEGIGVEITVQDGLVTVISPIAGSHAEEVGLQSGDQVIAVDSVDVTGMGPEDVTSMIRGPAGTTVLIRLKRPGISEPVEVNVERRRIGLNSVVYSGLIDSVGYIRLSRFSLTTADEISMVLQEFSRKGMSSLILDLRSNPGGFMSAAVFVAGLFLPKDKLILATTSVREWENYSVRTIENGPLVDIPLAVLIDRGSASASEIVAGTLQDYDRAVVLGDTTFGKGLVQTNLMIEGGGALRITTSKYYLPSGRLVQKFADKDWAERMHASRSELGASYRTEGGRNVYGGGGVAPDLHVGTEKTTLLAIVLSHHNYFFRFAVDYRAEHGGSIPDTVDDAVVDLFRRYVYDHDFRFPNPAEQSVSVLEESLLEMESVQGRSILAEMKRKARQTEDAAWERSRSHIVRNLSERFANIRGGLHEVYASSRLRSDHCIQEAVRILSSSGLYRSILREQRIMDQAGPAESVGKEG